MISVNGTWYLNREDYEFCKEREAEKVRSTKIEVDKCEFLDELVARMKQAGIEYSDAGCVCYLIMDIWSELENAQKITTDYDHNNLF